MLRLEAFGLGRAHKSREEPGADLVPGLTDDQQHMDHNGGRVNEVEGRQDEVQHRFLLKLSLNAHYVRYVCNVHMSF